MSITGYRRYVNFVDDFTRIIWVFPRITKTETFQVFKIFKTQVYKQLDKSTKYLQQIGEKNIYYLITLWMKKGVNLDTLVQIHIIKMASLKEIIGTI